MIDKRKFLKLFGFSYLLFFFEKPSKFFVATLAKKPPTLVPTLTILFVCLPKLDFFFPPILVSITIQEIYGTKNP